MSVCCAQRKISQWKLRWDVKTISGGRWNPVGPSDSSLSLALLVFYGARVSKPHVSVSSQYQVLLWFHDVFKHLVWVKLLFHNDYRNKVHLFVVSFKCTCCLSSLKKLCWKLLTVSICTDNCNLNRITWQTQNLLLDYSHCCHNHKNNLHHFLSAFLESK